MKRILCAAMILGLGTGLAGCYRFVPEHSEKSKKQFFQDRAYCQEKARVYTREYIMDRGAYSGYMDELNHTRRCMKGLGWDYRFGSTFIPPDMKKGQ